MRSGGRDDYYGNAGHGTGVRGMTGHVVMTGALHWHAVAVVFERRGQAWSARWVWPFRFGHALRPWHCPRGSMPDAGLGQHGCIAS